MSFGVLPMVACSRCLPRSDALILTACGRHISLEVLQPGCPVADNGFSRKLAWSVHWNNPTKRKARIIYYGKLWIISACRLPIHFFRILSCCHFALINQREWTGSSRDINVPIVLQSCHTGTSPARNRCTGDPSNDVRRNPSWASWEIPVKFSVTYWLDLTGWFL